LEVWRLELALEGEFSARCSLTAWVYSDFAFDSLHFSENSSGAQMSNFILSCDRGDISRQTSMRFLKPRQVEMITALSRLPFVAGGAICRCLSFSKITAFLFSSLVITRSMFQCCKTVARWYERFMTN
jgi:hypothetical protein